MVNLKKALKLPSMKGKDSWMVWGGGAVALLAVYFILSGKYTNIEPADDLLRGVGNRLGVEGIGDEYLDDIPLGREFVPTTDAQRRALAKKSAMYVDSYVGSDDEENRITVS